VLCCSHPTTPVNPYAHIVAAILSNHFHSGVNEGATVSATCHGNDISDESPVRTIKEEIMLVIVMKMHRNHPIAWIVPYLASILIITWMILATIQIIIGCF
jgi:hypothetical protein